MSVAIESVPTSTEFLAKWSTVHSAIAAVLAVSLSAATVVGISMPGHGQAILLAILLAVVGMPHGGLDHRFGRAVCRPWAGGWWPVVFATAYLGVASLVLAGWVIAPLATIALFFLMSAIHFADVGRFPMVAVEGGMVIWVPFLARPDEAIRLLAWVTPGRLTESIHGLAFQVRPLLWSLALVMAGRIMGLAWVAIRDRNPSAALKAFRLTAFAGFFATVPVLLGFITFFCGWHSTRELAELAARSNPARPSRGLVQVMRQAAPLSLLVVIATALAAWWRFAGGVSAVPVIVQAVFLGLSAVAVPHIVLHAIADKLHVDPFAKGTHS